MSLWGGLGPPVDVWKHPQPRLPVAAQVHILGLSLASPSGAASIIVGDFTVLALGQGIYNVVHGEFTPEASREQAALGPSAIHWWRASAPPLAQPGRGSTPT